MSDARSSKEQFTEWLCQEVPEGSVIADPARLARHVWGRIHGSPSEATEPLPDEAEVAGREFWEEHFAAPSAPHEPPHVITNRCQCGNPIVAEATTCSDCPSPACYSEADVRAIVAATQAVNDAKAAREATGLLLARRIIEQQDTYPNPGGRGAGLLASDAQQEVLNAYRDRLLDLIDDQIHLPAEPRPTNEPLRPLQAGDRVNMDGISGIVLEPPRVRVKWDTDLISSPLLEYVTRSQTKNGTP